MDGRVAINLHGPIYQIVQIFGPSAVPASSPRKVDCGGDTAERLCLRRCA